MASELAEKYTKGPFYLWAPMRNGGETMPVATPNGGTRTVIKERNILPAGKKVTQSELEASDEQWVEWVDGGAIRTYEYPDMPAGSDDSPVTFLQKRINEAAQSEEEKMVAMVQGMSSNDQQLVEGAAELDKAASNKTAEKK